ncbi:MAG TPA: PIG-L family deacetylase [Vicinamibacterales bacterium]|nr:PIG-L family deacetylase [Vicinamibacterales bacterium]
MTLGWAASSNATSYDVAFGTTNTPSVVSSAQTGTTYDPSGDLAEATTYFWRVIANGPGGSTAGPLWTFTTAAPTVPPPGGTPPDGATNVPVATALSWPAAADATKYDVHLDVANPPAILARNVSGTTYQPATPLSPSTTYYWQIDARGKGNSVTPGPVWRFATAAAPAAPSAPAPPDGAPNIALTATLAWAAATGATAYDVAFGTTNTPPVVSANQSALSLDPPGDLVSGTTYFWRVTAKGAGGSTAGPLWTFTTVPPPAPSTPASPAPADGAVNIAITAALGWAASTNASTYDVAFGTTNTPPVVSSSQTGTAYDPPGDLAHGTTYFWRVIATGPGGSTPGPVWTFTTTVPPAPSVPASPTPATAAENVPITASLGWASSTNAASYDVAFGTTNTPPVVSSNQIGTAYDPPGDLAHATTYFWRVTATGPGGSTPGPLWTFTTAAAPPAAPSAPVPANAATDTPIDAALGWTASTGATAYDVAFGTTNTPPVVSSNQTGTAYDPPGDLAHATTYFWRVTATGPGGSTPGPLWTFTTAAAPPAEFVSDDFNACALNQGPGAWTFSDPLGGAWYRTAGAGTGEAWLEIAVPAGVAHDPWNTSYNAPRVMRPIGNLDFELEVKFLSTTSLGYQVQGILIEQDPLNYLRFDVFHDGSSLKLFAARTTAGVSTFEYFDIPTSTPQYMRVKRAGNQWTQTYSADGSVWTPAASFSHVLVPARAGVFAANGGASPPAHTARFDYIVSTASPIVPEDGAATGQNFTLTLGVSGNGTVTADPNQSSHACGSLVTVTATPADGWMFTGWSGGLTGSQNPATVILSADKTVQALFSVMPPPAPPVITNVQVIPSVTGAAITWSTDKPASSRVDYGPTAGYGAFADSAALVTSHSITIANLNPTSLYHFSVTSTGSDGLSASSADQTFQTGADPSGFRSDDFNVCAVDEGSDGWSFSDPLGGSSYRTVGVGSGEAALEIAVPPGTAHDPWNASYNAPRLMRPIANTDFELEVKFLSSLTLGYQVQGILIEQDSLNYLRFDFFHDGDGLKIFAARTTNGVSTSEYNDTPAGSPRYMRIRRQGNQWTQSYSFDGSFWTTAAQFVHAFTPARAGLFAANAGTNPPAHTAQFDYIFSTAGPVSPEDGAPAGQFFGLTTAASGPGTVTRNPDLASYACGTLVTLTATPNPGYTLNGWSGAVVSTTNPIVIALTQDKSITAEFVVNVPPAISSVSVVPGDNWATVSWQTNEPSTTVVDYGLTQSLELGTRTEPGLVTAHVIHVTGLTAQTTYHLQLRSVDADGGASSVPGLTFTTTPAFPLAIANVQVATRDNSATISWQTNKPTSGSVTYGSSPALELGTVSNASVNTTHALTLTALNPGTQYFYRITGTDGSGVSAQSDVLVFTTQQIGPVIKTWYGDVQRFGHLGTPQTWVNVLGNVSDPDGVQHLHYSLNGGPLKALSMGPDTRRLARTGDFNVELRFSELAPGANSVRIIAIDRAGNTSEKTVSIDVTLGSVWTTPYAVDFSTVTDIQDVAQVVDGRWTLEGGAIRSVATGYDRLVAIGDVTWKNYEVTASITTHSFDPAGYAPPSYGAVVGLVLRWQGHSVWDNSQPSWGYWPAGATATYGWNPDETERRALIGNQDNQVSVNASAPLLEFNRTYIFKARVQTESTGQHKYEFKMWPADEAEPPLWQHQIRNGDRADDPTHGSVLLFAHNVDASFGSVSVTPLPDATPIDTTPPPPQTDVMIVAPHPDDDIIMGSGVIHRALQRNHSVRVVYIANGDVEGTARGLLRQAEAVDAEAVLGIPEKRLVFLGYPTFGLRNLQLFYTEPDSQFTSGSGASATYGTRGLGGSDYHTYRFGSPGLYNWPTMLGDLVDLINTTRPTHIFTTSQWETHPDHSTTHLLVKEAVRQVSIASGGVYDPTIHVTMIWPGELRDDGPWPSAGDPTAYFTEPPAIDPETPPWSDRESLDVPAAMQSTDLASNPKFRALAAHFTQFSQGYIGKFLHKDEFFWTEQLIGSNQPPVPNAGFDQTVDGGVLVTLNASASWDRNGDTVTYQWRQVGGPAVALSNTDSPHAGFVAPAGLPADTVLEFELVVSDGVLSSVPDAVRVIVRGSTPQ